MGALLVGSFYFLFSILPISPLIEPPGRTLGYVIQATLLSKFPRQCCSHKWESRGSKLHCVPQDEQWVPAEQERPEFRANRTTKMLLTDSNIGFMILLFHLRNEAVVMKFLWTPETIITICQLQASILYYKRHQWWSVPFAWHLMNGVVNVYNMFSGKLDHFAKELGLVLAVAGWVKVECMQRREGDSVWGGHMSSAEGSCKADGSNLLGIGHARVGSTSDPNGSKGEALWWRSTGQTNPVLNYGCMWHQNHTGWGGQSQNREQSCQLVCSPLIQDNKESSISFYEH